MKFLLLTLLQLLCILSLQAGYSFSIDANDIKNANNSRTITNFKTSFNVLTVDYIWNGSSSLSWTTNTNWTPNGVPGIGDNVLINTSTNAPVISTAITINNLSINGTGILNIAASGNLTIAGSFNFDNSGGASVSFLSGSSVTFSNTSSVTIPSLSYGNLIRAGTGLTTLSTSGIIGIKNSFTPGSATYSTTGSTIDFSSASSQSIPAFSYYNLSNSGNGPRTLSSGTINIAGTYTPTNGSLNVSTGTINFSGSGSQTIPATSYYNLTNSGNGARTYSSSGTIKINGDTHTPSTGTNTTTGSTIELATTTTMTLIAFPYNNVVFSGGGTIQLGTNVSLNISGYFQITGNGTLKIGTSGGSNIMTVQGDFNVDNTCTSCKVYLVSSPSSSGAILNVNGSMALNGGNTALINLESSESSSGAGVINIAGDLNVTGTNSNLGVINFGDGAGSNNTGNKVVLSGNFSQSGNGLFNTTGTGNPDGFIFNKSGEQSFSYTGTSAGHVRWQVNSGSTLKLSSNFPISTSSTPPSSTVTVLNGGAIDFGTFSLTGGYATTSININSGATLKTANAAGINSSGATGSIQTTGTRYFDSGASYEFQGANTGIFTTSPSSNTVKNLIINNSSGIVGLSQNFTVTGSLLLSNGLLKMNAYNLIANTGSISGYSSSRYIITNGSGTLKINNIGSSPQTFPIGPNEYFYNPFSFANTGGTVNVTASVDETITDNGNIDPNKIVNTEWNISPSGTANASLVFNWNAAQQGNQFSASIGRVYHYYPPWAFLSSSSVTGTTASVSGVTSFSPFLIGNEEFYLPIELSKFTGETKEGKNILHWTTLSEKDADKIIIEKVGSLSNAFEEIGIVKAIGNSTSAINYEFIDEKPYSINYYRLKLVDLDKTYTYSKLIELTNTEVSPDIFLFPNPADQILNLRFFSASDKEYEISLTSPIAKLINKSYFSALKGINQYSLNIDELGSGMYYISLKTEGFYKTITFIKK